MYLYYENPETPKPKVSFSQKTESQNKVFVITISYLKVCMLFRMLFTGEKPVQGKFSITEESLIVSVNDFIPPKLFQTKPTSILFVGFRNICECFSHVMEYSLY